MISPEPMSRESLAGRKVTVMGLGLFGGGQGLTEFLCRAGADVLVTDLRDAETLQPSIDALKGLPIKWVLGEHRNADFLGSDLVFANPAVPRDAKILSLCRDKGIPLETEMNLFFKLCRGRICGITGSNGKTTTTCLTARMLQNANATTRVGGNLGVSLLNDLDSISSDDWVVLELSSFQLEDLRAIERRPDVALVNNLSPNHLNRHKTYRNYIEAKRVILEGNDNRSWAILNGDDTVVRSWARRTSRRVTYFGRVGTVMPRARGVWVRDDEIVFSDGETSERLFQARDLCLPGRFNLINAAGAAAAALAANCPAEAIQQAVHDFKPIEHRVELVGNFGEVGYYNDSIATTPESTLCAIEALGPDLILIAGGSDKGKAARVGVGRILPPLPRLGISRVGPQRCRQHRPRTRQERSTLHQTSRTAQLRSLPTSALGRRATEPHTNRAVIVRERSGTPSDTTREHLEQKQSRGWEPAVRGLDFEKST